MSRKKPPFVIDQESSFCGCIHNVQLTTENDVWRVHPSLYVAVEQGKVTYDLPLDAPIYPKVFICNPDENDIAESAVANKKEG